MSPFPPEVSAIHFDHELELKPTTSSLKMLLISSTRAQSRARVSSIISVHPPITKLNRALSSIHSPILKKELPSPLLLQSRTRIRTKTRALALTPRLVYSLQRTKPGSW